MADTASPALVLMRRLQELKEWQKHQQQKLLHQQQLQRQKLSSEQQKLYELFGLQQGSDIKPEEKECRDQVEQHDIVPSEFQNKNEEEQPLTDTGSVVSVLDGVYPLSETASEAEEADWDCQELAVSEKFQHHGGSEQDVGLAAEDTDNKQNIEPSVQNIITQGSDVSDLCDAGSQLPEGYYRENHSVSIVQMNNELGTESYVANMTQCTADSMALNKHESNSASQSKVQNIDDCPITSVGKSFYELLDEKLWEHGLQIRGNFIQEQENAHKPKKCFLRKGEGTARFQMKNAQKPGKSEFSRTGRSCCKKNDGLEICSVKNVCTTKIQNMSKKQSSYNSSTSKIKLQNSSSSRSGLKMKSDSCMKQNGAEELSDRCRPGRSAGTTKKMQKGILQKQVKEKEILKKQSYIPENESKIQLKETGPQKQESESVTRCTTLNDERSLKKLKQATNTAKNAVSDATRMRLINPLQDSVEESFWEKIHEADRRHKKENEELHVFEVLEEIAADSSFCSTSSVVMKLMENSVKSTPVRSTSEVSQNVHNNKSSHLLSHGSNYGSGQSRSLHIESFKDRNEKELSVSSSADKNSIGRVSASGDLIEDGPQLNVPSSKGTEKEKGDYFTSEVAQLPYGTDYCESKTQSEDRIRSNENDRVTVPSVSRHVKFSELPVEEYDYVSNLETEEESQNEKINDFCDSENSDREVSQGVTREMGVGTSLDNHYLDFDDEDSWSDVSSEYSSTDDSAQSQEVKAITVNAKMKTERDKGNIMTFSPSKRKSLDLTFSDLMWNASCKNSNHKTGKERNIVEQKCTVQDKTSILKHATLLENGSQEKGLVSEEIEKSNYGVKKKKNAEDGDVVFKSTLLHTRVIELEQEIEIFKKENESVKRLRMEHEKEMKQLQKERLEFQNQRAEQKKKMEELVEHERQKLKREKQLFERCQREMKIQSNKKEKEEIKALNEQLLALQEEMKRREGRWAAAQRRVKERLQQLERENGELKEELSELKQDSTKVSSGNRGSKQFSNTKEIHRINQQLSTKKWNQRDVEKGVRNDSSNDFVIEVFPTKEIPDSVLGGTLSRLSDVSTPKTKNKNKGKKTEEKKLTNVDVCSEQENSNNVCEKSKIFLEEKQQEVTVEKLRNVFYPQEVCNLSDSEVDNISKKSVTFSDNNNIELIKLPHPYEEVLNKENCKITKEMSNVTESEYHDGHKEKCFPGGNKELLYENGNRKEVSADGNTSKVFYFNGDIKETSIAGVVKYFYAETHTWHITYPDGSQVLEFQNGQVERHDPNGITEIIFADGSMKYIHKDQSEECIFPDGTVVKIDSNGNKTLILPNGQKEIHTPDEKRREYPDGTVKIIHSDGRQETRYSSGRVRIKDINGALLVDSKYT